MLYEKIFVPGHVIPDNDIVDRSVFIEHGRLVSYMSRLMGKPTMWFPNRSNKNQAAQSQKQARSLKFRTQEEEGLYYSFRENKGADQLREYCEADLRLCFRIS